MPSSVITSQLPIDRWHEIIGDPTYADAILDRLIHNAHRIELAGESLRRTQAKQGRLDPTPQPVTTIHRPARLATRAASFRPLEFRALRHVRDIRAAILADMSRFSAQLCGDTFDGNCVGQPGTTEKLETLPAWTMWRLQYRNFGDHESLVTNHTVNADGHDKAGIRWYEFRRPPQGAWSLFQQGTYSPEGDSRSAIPTTWRRKHLAVHRRAVQQQQLSRVAGTRQQSQYRIDPIRRERSIPTA